MSTDTAIRESTVVSLIPDSAPFTVEQRAWLNGFLAGWLGVNPSPAIEQFPDGASLSSLGPVTANNQVAVDDSSATYPWHSPDLPIDKRLALAEKRPLELQLMSAMAQLNCGACGYLCKTYSEAIARGDEKNLALCSPGGKETAKAIKRLVAANRTSPTPVVTNTQKHERPPIGSENLRGYHRTQPVELRFVASHNLNGEGSRKYTAHVVLDLAHTGVQYRVGDSLGIFPTNCPELVDAILDQITCPPGESTVGDMGNKPSLRDALRREFDLANVTDELLQLLLERSTEAGERQLLSELLDGQSESEVYDVLDLLIHCRSVRLKSSELVHALARLQPRLYSISSSPARHPGEVHLTVARVAYSAHGRERKGVASTMFADRLVAGETLSAFVHRSHGFTVPSNPEAPMIMIGPGTGIAPFRAFLQERSACHATGRNWLFFGDQHAATDFLYRDELKSYQDCGLLTHLDTAFSRDQSEKIYVQDRLRQRQEDVFSWLEQGAYLFVCGDAQHMAHDVDLALRDIIARSRGWNAETCDQYVANLIAEKRYVRDVY